MTLADFQLVDVVGEHRVQPFGSRRTGDEQLSHMRNIEDADVVSHRLMFLDDAGVLHRHEPAAEWNNFRAAPYMLFVQRCDFLRALIHAGKLGVDKK